MVTLFNKVLHMSANEITGIQSLQPIACLILITASILKLDQLITKEKSEVVI